ncbi:unnamed protein product [Cladocopium goreaui]|uniref:RRM domain-containing protein n=1 Tax=Cladocopium goreaui TaxID=2562237 RepID=A0A9P1DL86_9DINO|nr:unnamed protein product [Cladocopium goreaui]
MNQKPTNSEPVKRWHRHRPEKPEGWTIEECWHSSNREATQMTAKEGHKDQLRRIFEVFGEIHNVYNHTRQMWCWVQFASPETTQKVGLGKVLNRSGADLAAEIKNMTSCVDLGAIHAPGG